MTLNDLKDEISALGFESEISADKNFIIAVRRALRTIYTERSVYKTLTLEHYPTEPSLIFELLRHNPEKREEYLLKGEAYSFKTSGRGAFSITEGGKKTEHKFDTPTAVWRGFISSEAKIEFYGESRFAVISLATFSALSTLREEEIPLYSHPYEYRMKSLAPDFHSFSSLPLDAEEKEISGAHLLDEKLILPSGFSGRVNLTYKAAAPHVSLDNLGEELSLPSEIEHLVALLAAAYYWLDDDADKAEFYLSLYKDALRATRYNDTRRLGGGYRNVTGWA